MRCRHIKVTRLRLTSEVSAQLREMGLKEGDLDLIIGLARKVEQDDAILFEFDFERIPPDARRNFERLRGVVLIAISGEITAVRRKVGVAESQTEDESK